MRNLIRIAEKGERRGGKRERGMEVGDGERNPARRLEVHSSTRHCGRYGYGLRPRDSDRGKRKRRGHDRGPGLCPTRIGSRHTSPSPGMEPCERAPVMIRSPWAAMAASRWVQGTTRSRSVPAAIRSSRPDRPRSRARSVRATIAGGKFEFLHLDSGVTEEIARSGQATLLGGSGPTEFVGGRGSVVMQGGTGSDTFVGGSGHDTMIGGSGGNLFEFLHHDRGGQHVIQELRLGAGSAVSRRAFAGLPAEPWRYQLPRRQHVHRARRRPNHDRVEGCDRPDVEGRHDPQAIV